MPTDTKLSERVSKGLEYEKTYSKQVASPFDEHGTVPPPPQPTIVTQSEKDLQSIVYTKKAGSIYNFRK
jgi:hypothetical protein